MTAVATTEARLPSFLGFRGSNLTTARILIIMLPSFVLFGYNQSNLGNLLTLPDWSKTFPRIDEIYTTGATKSNNTTVAGLVNATFTLGALFGCLSCSYTAEKFGRRPIIFAGALCTLIGEILQASAFALPQLIVGRVILGAGVGMLSGTAPMWQSECSDAQHRGQHVVIMGAFISLGYVLEAWINLGFFQFQTGPLTWRPAIAIPAVFSIMIMIFVFFMPESPRWLMQHNKESEARYVLAALKGTELDSTEVDVVAADMQRSFEESPAKVSLAELFTMGEDRLFYRFGICIFLQFVQQMSGGNLISVYSTVIFEQGLGMSAQMSRILSGATLTWKFMSCFVAFFTIDRFGRRLSLMVSGTGMACCMLGLAVSTSFPKSNFPAQVFSVLFVFLFNFFIPIGFLGTNFLYCAEVAPQKLRSAMSSISTANTWLWNFLVVMITPVAIDNIGYKYYIVYTCIGFTIPPAIYYFYPETMGLSLEEIDHVFRESPSVMGTVKYARYRTRQVVDETVLGKADSFHVEGA